MKHRQSMTTARPSTRAFTLVEVLIVVVILSILAAMVMSLFRTASEQSRENATRMDLHRIRTQLEIYKQQHNGEFPTLADFIPQMTQASDAEGATAAPGTDGYPLGPYLREVPANPATSTSTLGNGAVGSSAWYYDETEGAFLANNSLASREY